MTVTELHYSPARWVYDVAAGRWQFFEAGYFDSAVRREPRNWLRAEEVELLIRALDEGGWIKPRLDERVRAEDLKITHRLLDLLEKSR